MRIFHRYRGAWRSIWIHVPIRRRPLIRTLVYVNCLHNPVVLISSWALSRGLRVFPLLAVGILVFNDYRLMMRFYRAGLRLGATPP